MRWHSAWLVAQPIADAVKLLLKEDIIPESADKCDFPGWLHCFLATTAGMVAMAALPFGPFSKSRILNVGLLFVLGIGSVGIFRNRARRLGLEQSLFVARRASKRRATSEL